MPSCACCSMPSTAPSPLSTACVIKLVLHSSIHNQQQQALSTLQPHLDLFQQAADPAMMADVIAVLLPSPSVCCMQGVLVSRSTNNIAGHPQRNCSQRRAAGADACSTPNDVPSSVRRAHPAGPRATLEPWRGVLWRPRAQAGRRPLPRRAGVGQHTAGSGEQQGACAVRHELQRR